MSPLFKTGLVLLAVILLVGAAVVVVQGDLRLPPYDEGYEPAQPLAFSHRLHAGELQIGCLFCHPGAERSRHAGIPPLATCFNCHQFIPATQNARRLEEAAAQREQRPLNRVVAPDLARLYHALGLDDEARPDSSLAPSSIRWVRVHNLPDFVQFNHARHVNGGVACSACHGAVETMERIRQVSDLSMGFCVNCHRVENVKFRQAENAGARRDRARLDCDACHY